MVLGVVLMLSSRDKSTGLILFIIGAAFLTGDLFGWKFRDLVKFVIPGVIILIGISLIFPRNFFKSKKHTRRFNVSNQETDRLDDLNIFSGQKKTVSSKNFTGGEITCIFGGTELNLKDAVLAEGNNVLEVTCIFGGCSIFVPEDWTVKFKPTAIFGGFSDERIKRNPYLVSDPNKVLIIEGVIIFGGGEIKTA
jgi:predicted membrane protein